MPEERPNSKFSAQTQARLRKMERTFKKGEKLFIEGDEAGDMYILLSGSLKIMNRGVQVATVNTPGSYVGEMSVLLDEPRTATVVAMEDCKVLAVPKNDILEFLTHAPELAFKLARILATRLKQTNTGFATYRREMSERFKNLSARAYKVFLLSKSPSRTAHQDMNWEIRDAVAYLASLKPLDEDKREDKII